MQNFKLSLLSLTFALLFLCLFSLFLGPVKIPLENILRMLRSLFGGFEDTSLPLWQKSIILQVRIPRVLAAAAAGAMLATAGCVLQAVFRNPLASPDILGVAAGSSLGAITALYFNFTASGTFGLALAALLGGVTTCLVIYRIAARDLDFSSNKLLLSGIAVGSLNIAASSLLLSLSFENYEIGKQFIFWTLGGLDSQTWTEVSILAPSLLFGTGALIYFYRDLDCLSLGDLHAASVGCDVNYSRRRLIIIACLLTAFAVSCCGTIGFVGLVVPHLIRLVVGPGHKALLPTCILGGASFLVLADLIARTIIAPQELRIGVVTSLAGAPFFLYLLHKSKPRG